MQSKSVLVTGSSRGIGRAIALRLAADGHRVAVHFAKDELAARTVGQELGDRCIGVFQADLSDPQNGTALWKDVNRVESLHGLINNAGIYEKLSFLDSESTAFDSAWERTFRVNFWSPLALVRAACADFREQGGGTVINVASRVGHRGEAGASCYSASKAALLNLTRALAVEHAKLNIQHFAIAPGWVETAMAREGMEQRLPQILADIPLGRMATPEDCAAAAAFLMRPETAYLSGIVIDINGASYLR
ncbi:MAG: SDR family oxidoreductase [Fimbriimonadaceae bacterium]|nr:SDR family oxidoreductase [Fimbriimonadaceae bacterium]